MAIQKFNAVGGYSTGLTATAVIDATGNITGVAGTFTGTFIGTTGSFSNLLTLSSGLSVTGTSTFIGDVIVRSGDIETTSSVFSFVTNTASTINIGTISGSTISIGNASGTTTIRNAGTNINGNLTVSGSSSFGAAVDHTFGLSNRGVLINAGKGNSEILSYGNETLDVSAISGNGILNLYGTVVTIGDDANNNVTQIIVDDSTQTITHSATQGHIFDGTGSFSGLLTATAGISVSGATAAIFNGTVSCNSSTIHKPTLQYYNEVLASPTISANVLTLDLSTAQMFTVSLNANITTFTISNTPATANRSIGFTLIFTADGTARTVTWGAAVKWANNDPPALTSTNGKKDILSFVSPDGGTNWYGFIGGLNF
jgi:hypothetical protein